MLFKKEANKVLCFAHVLKIRFGKDLSYWKRIVFLGFLWKDDF